MAARTRVLVLALLAAGALTGVSAHAVRSSAYTVDGGAREVAQRPRPSAHAARPAAPTPRPSTQIVGPSTQIVGPPTQIVGPSSQTVDPSTQIVGPATHKPGKRAQSVRYTFDGTAPLADVSGNGHDLSPVSRNGGTFTMVRHAGGNALAFPPPCHAEPCPRIALRAPTTSSLNPGRRRIRFGATVRLAADRTTKGENVLQKGFSARGSQYKLQIDGVAGQPSCVLVDNHRPEIHVALSVVSVADDRWHTLECRRNGPRLTIRVDGVLRGATRIPADLTVRNSIPFSVGGKGSFADNDQFQGVLDEVWLRIG